MDLQAGLLLMDAVELTLPRVEPGRFQGLFFENVETEYTDQLIG
jgi:hypothetical protein